MALLSVTQSQWNDMVVHVTANAPEEACGLLGGLGGRTLQVVPVENTVHSPVAYAMEPQAQVEAMMAFEAQGWDLLAIFHSHPAGPAAPSQTDVRQAYYPDSLYVILSPAPAGGWQARAFQIEAGAVVESEFRIEPDE